MEEPIKEFKRGRILYSVYKKKVLVKDGVNSWVTYNTHNNWNRQGLSDFIQEILKSSDDQLSTSAELMELAYKHKVVAVGTGPQRGII